MAPPRRYVNSRVKMIGLKTASKSCSGTCFIFKSARHPKVSEAERAFAFFGLSPEASAERRLSSSIVLDGVVMRLPPFIVGLFMFRAVSGEGEEHFVEARLAEGEVGYGNAGS